MNGEGELDRAYRGEGALFQSILEARRHEMAESPEGLREQPAGSIAALLLRGAAGCWALPLAEAARVDVVPRFVTAPLRGAPLLGLGLVSGRRCILADLESLVTDAPLRPRDRAGHAVVLRRSALALVVERVEAVSWLVPAPPPVPAAGPDGIVWLNAAWLTARLGGTAS